MRLVYQLGVSNRLTATPGDAIPLPPKDGSPLTQNLMATVRPQHRRHDLRAATSEIRPDWDLSTLGLREACDVGDYSHFHGWDRRSPQSKPTSYES